MPRVAYWIAGAGAGVRLAAVGLHAGATAYRQLVFRWQFASAGTHRLTIRPAGNGRVTLDGFLALR